MTGERSRGVCCTVSWVQVRGDVRSGMAARTSHTKPRATIGWSKNKTCKSSLSCSVLSCPILPTLPTYPALSYLPCPARACLTSPYFTLPCIDLALLRIDVVWCASVTTANRRKWEKLRNDIRRFLETYEERLRADIHSRCIPLSLSLMPACLPICLLACLPICPPPIISLFSILS